MSALAALAVINPLQVRHDPLLCPVGVEHQASHPAWVS